MEPATNPGPGEIERFSRVYSISGCDVPSYATSIERTSRPEPIGRPAAIWIRGKGRTEKERMTLPDQTAAALVEWIEARGNESGSLFHRLDGPKPAPDVRLSGESVRRIVRGLGKAAGLPRDVRPHGLRHSAATSALDAGRDLRDVRRFTRHRSLEVVLRYDDMRRDVAGEIARDLAGRRDQGREV